MKKAGEQSDIDYIMDSVEFDTNGGCWLWNRAVQKSGYGTAPRRFVSRIASRAAWGVFRGDPGDKFVCHKCDVPLCVNPDHLYLGTSVENMADMVRRNRCSPVRRFGVDVGTSKIDESAVVAIRLSDEPYAVLAARYGVGEGNIKAIRRGLSWPHVLPKSSPPRKTRFVEGWRQIRAENGLETKPPTRQFAKMKASR